ncbi:MAG: hypothetical protein KC474_06295 [Cyanobacteria bacterium HKST-UBA04]|nr:hypothetical protein [Cyanobacteria bacterium HKST-UBA04]MCA9841930.1 hypothetical protein [Cyanobacteria bacterium HKST-UBA03]
MKQPGFTLADAAIALMLLGVISAHFIPKVLKTVSDQRSGSVIREAVGMLEDAYYSNKMAGLPFPTAGLYAYLADDINYLDYTSASAPAGYTAGVGDDCSDLGGGTITLPSGAFISGLTVSAANDYHVICIDLDGTSGKNLIGSDQFLGQFINRGSSTTKAFYWSSLDDANAEASNNNFCDHDETEGTCNNVLATVLSGSDDVATKLIAGT